MRSARYDVILNGCISLIFLLCPPKLVHLKFANKSQTVGKRYQGWRSVSTQRHRSDGTAGKAAYHKQYCSSRAEHQALAAWKYLGRTPLYRLPHFGAHLVVDARPVLCALSTNLDDNSTHFCVLLSSVACFAIGVVVNIVVTVAQTHKKSPVRFYSAQGFCCTFCC